MWSIARSDLVSKDADNWPWPLVVRDDRRARRLKLRLDPRRRQLILTCPPRTSRRAALQWAAHQRDWANEQIAQMPCGEPLVPGAEIPFDGREIVLRWDPSAPRTPALEGSVLIVGGPRDAIAARVQRWMKAEALRLLSAETADAAARAGVCVSRVSIGDAETRWGSCSSAGAIRYNWRLVLAPPAVRRWVVAHEVAHRLHMNHGPAFKLAERQIYQGDATAARSELRRIAPRLKGVGRGV